MKLLPMFTSFVKDGAKAVKRISQQEFKEVPDETLTELLDIPTLVVTMYALHQTNYQRVCRGHQKRFEDNNTHRFRIQEFRQLQTPCISRIRHFSR